MRLLWSMTLVTATSVAACKSGQEQPGATKPSPSVQSSALVNGADVTPAKEKPKPLVREGNTVAHALTEEALYIADEDRGQVLRVALPVDVNKPPTKIAISGQPAQVVVLGDKVLVTVRSEGAEVPAADKTAANEAPVASASPSANAPPPPEPKVKMPVSPTGAGLLLVMRPDAEKGLVQTARIELPQDAWGIAVSPDESLAVVTSAWTHKVSVVDLVTNKVKSSVDVAREPRAAVFHPSGKAAYVTHLVGADITRIDGLDSDAPSVRPVKLPPSPSRTAIGTSASASLAYSATLSPDGKRLFVPRHALGAQGEQVWLGTSAIDVLLTADDSPLAPPHTDRPRDRVGGLEGSWLLANEETGGDSPHVGPNPFVQPRAVAYRKKDDTVLIASEGLDSVVSFFAKTIEPALFVKEKYLLTLDKDPQYGVSNGCAAPSGIALSPDENTAWVFCRASATLVIISFDHEGPRPWVRLAEDPLSNQAAMGRKVFYNGTDEVTSGGMGCAGCHPEGRDDGHVWREAFFWDEERRFFAGRDNIPDEGGDNQRGGFARQTPMLAGRLIAEGPYGWHAESPHLTHRLTNGFRLHRWAAFPYGHHAKELHDRAMALRAFLRQGLALPPVPGRELTEEEKKGKEIFNRIDTKCAGCHVPETIYSDRAPYPVYSMLPPIKGFDEDPEKQYKTPSLRFVGGTPPYTHDGRYSTLEELIELNDDRMGNTKQLTKPERAALVAFLRTL